MRSRFEEQLGELKVNLIEMGGLIENAISMAVKALVGQDAEMAEKVMGEDDVVDNKEKFIESLCLRLILQQQPVAKDLRFISTALKMITDMERIGDQAADISELTIYLAKEEYIKKMVHIPQMGEATIKMVTESIDAFVKNDLELAKAVIEHDDVVDDLFSTVRNDLIALIRQDVNSSEQAMDLMMVAKYFERIGDHAVNIAEWVVFSITGEHKDKKIL